MSSNVKVENIFKTNNQFFSTCWMVAIRNKINWVPELQPSRTRKQEWENVEYSFGNFSLCLLKRNQGNLKTPWTFFKIIGLWMHQNSISGTCIRWYYRPMCSLISIRLAYPAIIRLPGTIIKYLLYINLYLDIANQQCSMVKWTNRLIELPVTWK